MANSAGLFSSPLILGALLIFFFARPTLAFGAGNIASISKVEGQNCKLSCYTQLPPPLAPEISVNPT